MLVGTGLHALNREATSEDDARFQQYLFQVMLPLVGIGLCLARIAGGYL